MTPADLEISSEVFSREKLQNPDAPYDFGHSRFDGGSQIVVLMTRRLSRLIG